MILGKIRLQQGLSFLYIKVCGGASGREKGNSSEIRSQISAGDGGIVRGVVESFLSSRVRRETAVRMRTYRMQIRLIQFSVFLSLLVMAVGFFGLWGNRGGNEPAVTQPQTQTQEEPADTLKNTKIVALGDSFTIGHPGRVEKSWPQVLADTLEISVVNKGKTRQTAMDLLSRFDADVVSELPGRVIIFVGNGDAINDVPLETYQTNVKAIIEKAEANQIIPILALPMPYSGVQQTIKEFREWELNYAQEKKILVLDFASVVMDANNKYLEGFSDGEGKYPTEKGYKTMGEYAARVLK